MNKLLQYLTNKPDVNHRALPGLEKFMRGGQPCYECGGSVKRYDVGGFYDCPDQEKDPVTGKCKAEVVRGREAAAANKAANADMNAWAKQVAAMDKEVAKQNAAQAAGQLSFDYDWMQSPVDKADKKAAMAQYKQFFQQNPNVFVPDDTSGYSPEQKYIIASKLKQRLSTPMGAQLAQKKLGVDPRYYDLQRMQSELAPKMGGWEGMRNFLFNVYKQNGGSTNQNAFTLPEVVVIGGKDKPTVNAYQKETNKLVYSDNDPYYGVDEYANHYAKTQIAKQYGVPKIRPTEAPSGIKSFMRNRSGIKSSTNIPNPSYIPRTKTTYADFNDRYTQEYLPELSHYVSQNRQGFFDYNKGRLLDGLEYLKGNSPYKVKGTEENFAHEVIQPELTQAFMNKFEEGRAMAMSAAASAMERKKLEKKKQEGGEYDLPQAQWGSLVNPSSMATMATIAAKAKEFFGFNEPKIVRTPASAPKRLSIRDPRKVMMTTGKPLRPNSDLVTGQYDSEHLGNLLTEAKRRNMSYNDMMNLAAMGFQETKWGRSDDNIGHTKGEFGDEPMQDSYSNFIDAYNAKMKDADRLKIKDEATRLQVYNGLGKIFPSTEADYHGFKMQKIYGVPVPKGGIDLRKNPLYGKQVIDIRDNVLKRNPEFMRYMDSTYRAPMPKEKEFANGGPILDPRGQWAHPGKVTRIPGSSITMQDVPYPVFGVGSNGQKQMMYPGQEYNFGGASYVDEYPMMQGGGFKPPFSGTFEDAKKRWEDGYIPPKPTNAAVPERKFLTDWNNSPMGKQMLYNSVDKDDPSGINSLYADKIIRDRDALVKQSKVNVYNHKTYNKLISKYPNFTASSDPDSGTAGYASRGRLNFNNNKFDKYTFNAGLGMPNNKYAYFSTFEPKNDYDIHLHNESEADASNQTLVHELSHASDASGYLMPLADEKKIKTYSYGSDGKRKLTDYQKYVADPSETRARLLNFRYNAKNQGIYNPFTQKATFDSLKKYEDRIGSGYDPLQQLRDVYTDSQIIDMLNTISKKQSNELLPFAKNGGQHGGLDRWFAEKWVDVKTGKACGRQEGEKRAGYPACRPSRRVSSQTPKTASEMSSAEKAKFKASKTSSQRINYNHKRNK